MSLPVSEQTPDDPERLPPARRRRARRLLAPLAADERADFIDRLAQLASPSFEFFILSLLAGIILAVGLRLDAPALLVLAAALAPLMTPLVGVALGAVVGASNHFGRSLAGLLIGCAFIFGCAWAAGRLTPPADLPLVQAPLLTHLNWISFLALAVGAILTSAGVLRAADDEQRLVTVFPNAALVYGLFTPLAAAGLGLGAGIPYLWPDGLVIFALYLAWSILFSIFTLGVLGVRPLTLFGYTVGGALALIGVIFVIGLSSVSAVVTNRLGLPTLTPTLTPTATFTLTPTLTPVPPTATLTPTLTATLTPSLTPTLTLTPTPVYASVRSPEGVRLRAEPAGATVTFLSNNTQVVVLGETQVVNGQTWMRVRTLEGLEGWILAELVVR